MQVWGSGGARRFLGFSINTGGSGGAVCEAQEEWNHPQVGTHTHTHAYTYIYPHTCVHTHIHASISTHTHVHIYTHIHTSWPFQQTSATKQVVTVTGGT